MCGFAIAELDFQLMHAALRRLQLLDLGPELVAIRQAFVKLCDLLPQHPAFLFINLARLFRCLTDLLRSAKFIGLSRHSRVDLADPLVAIREACVKLGHLVAQHPAFLFMNLTGLFRCLTSLLRSTKLIDLSRRKRLKLARASTCRRSLRFQIHQTF